MIIMFIRIASALAAVALGTVGMPDSASARVHCSETSNGHTICRKDNGHSGSDYIMAWDRRGNLVTEMSVICTGGGGNRWTAKSSYPKYENQKLANSWCDNYQ